MTQMDRALPVILTELSEVAFQANKEGFNVPPSQIMKTVFADNVSPLAAYQRLTQEERGKRAQAELDKRIADAKDGAQSRKGLYEEIKSTNDQTRGHIEDVRKELSDKIDAMPDRVIAILRNFGVIGHNRDSK